MAYAELNIAAPYALLRMEVVSLRTGVSLTHVDARPTVRSVSLSAPASAFVLSHIDATATVRSVQLQSAQGITLPSDAPPGVLLEDGFALLLEDGNALLLEG